MYGILQKETSDFVVKDKTLRANAWRLFTWCIPRFKKAARFKKEPERGWISEWAASNGVSEDGFTFVQFGSTEPAKDLFGGATNMAKTYRKELTAHGILVPIECTPNRHHAPIYVVGPVSLGGNPSVTLEHGILEGNSSVTPDEKGLEGNRNAATGYETGFSGVMPDSLTCENATLPKYQDNNPSAAGFLRRENPPLKEDAEKCPSCGSRNVIHTSTSVPRQRECAKCGMVFNVRG